ncbi:glycolipid 2-alpha-mannosyltransferase-domain-containing protein [Xylariaceae sp. FL0255]|nr:glycolipid 2-alpha-mannosyltransferase-domain-containing protein [Xylariaceae sp. FL0255]
MSGVHHRHAAGVPGAMGEQGLHVRHRSDGGHGHRPAWSTSSAEGFGDDLTKLALSTTPMLDDPDNKQPRIPDGGVFARGFRPFTLRNFIAFLCLFFVLFGSAWFIRKDQFKKLALKAAAVDMYLPPMAHLSDVAYEQAQLDPLQWLRDNTILDINEISEEDKQFLLDSRPKAAFIALVRNSEVEEMVYSMAQLEARFNDRFIHRYDWVFFNDEEFTEEFMAYVANATQSMCHFEVIPDEHWSVPAWIDTTRFDVGRQFMGSIGVGKAWLQSYHHMCRWNAGLFALEKGLANYDYFWRVEPGVEFSCNINYDVFRFMRDNEMEYGFNMAILDDARSFPSLWDRTRSFIRNNAELVHEEADFDWLLQETRDGFLHSDELFDEDKIDALDHLEYNNCQFYSNFEVGSLNFFRSKEHRAYFEHLDKTGGFYYERFGDAPIHTLSVSLFLPKRRIWYFRNIGYAHGLCEQCPPHMNRLNIDKEPQHIVRALATNASLTVTHRRWEVLSHDVVRQSGIPGLSCGCTVSAIDRDNSKLVPYESKQRKPQHTCIRLFLEGEWLNKKANWSEEAEIAAGRDGSGGYLWDGLEGNPLTVTNST